MPTYQLWEELEFSKFIFTRHASILGNLSGEEKRNFEKYLDVLYHEQCIVDSCHRDYSATDVISLHLQDRSKLYSFPLPKVNLSFN